MKNKRILIVIAILFLLIAGMLCKAQPHILPKIDTINKQYDTIPVVMLISDTSYLGFNNTRYYDVINWHFGYEVYKRQCIEPYIMQDYEPSNCLIDVWKHYKYLNFEKQDIDKNILIWMSVKKQ